MLLRQFRTAFPAALAAPGGHALRLHPVFSVLAASLIAALPVHAMAQQTDDNVSVRNRARAEYDPLGTRLGGFNLNATLDLGVASTDNLFATETGAEDDIIYRVAPSARLSSNWSRHALMFDAGAELRTHQEFGSEDTETLFAGVAGRLDVGSATELQASARIATEVEPRTDPDALTFNEPVEYSRTEFRFSAQQTFNRLRVRGTFANVEYDYDDAGGVDQDFRDSDEQAFTLRGELALTPRIGLVLEATADERNYDNTPTLNSDGRTYLAGISVNLTDLMRGELTVGSFERDYDLGGSVEGTAIAGNLEWYITRLTTLTFHASQSGEESGAFVALPYTEGRYGARIDHELLRNLILTAGVNFGSRDYEVIDREDEYMSGDIGLDYFINRRVAVNLRYSRDEMESNGVDRYRDYDVGVISAGLSLRL